MEAPQVPPPAEASTGNVASCASAKICLTLAGAVLVILWAVLITFQLTNEKGDLGCMGEHDVIATMRLYVIPLLAVVAIMQCRARHHGNTLNFVQMIVLGSAAAVLLTALTDNTCQLDSHTMPTNSKNQTYLPFPPIVAKYFILVAIALDVALFAYSTAEIMKEVGRRGSKHHNNIITSKRYIDMKGRIDGWRGSSGSSTGDSASSGSRPDVELDDLAQST